MSHFTVLVIGEDVEGQLAPYHEYECTGDDNEYVQDIDVTEKVQKNIDERGLKEGLDWEYGFLTRIVDDEGKVNKEKNHKYGYAVVKNGKLIKAVKRTNPNSKWDWYIIGGRWTGFFPLKEGVVPIIGSPGLMTTQPTEGRGDQARKKDIDIERARIEVENTARSTFAKWSAILAEHGVPESLVAVQERIGKGNEEEARRVFMEQPAVWEVFRQRLVWECPVKFFGFDEEAFVDKHRKTALSTYAVVKDGKWYSNGELGWFCTEGGQGDDRRAVVRKLLSTSR